LVLTIPCGSRIFSAGASDPHLSIIDYIFSALDTATFSEGFRKSLPETRFRLGYSVIGQGSETRFQDLRTYLRHRPPGKAACIVKNFVVIMKDGKVYKNLLSC
jgi:hypothetical protein